MDFEKHQNLHTIILLRDVIRKWWQAKLNFANRHGVVADWDGGEEGYHHCKESVRVLHQRFTSAKKFRRALFHDCHPNFRIVGAPIFISGEYAGFLFVEGIAKQSVAAANIEQSIVPPVTSAEMDKLTDLLEFAAEEIGNFEAEQAKREEKMSPAAGGALGHDKFEDIVGKSAQMLEIFRLLDKIANSESTVLINGESGTGKELVARAIHFHGSRKDKAFVVQNCSAFNDNLLESALFGHVKGSFTGALRDRKGLFEVADGGTFFLDEVGDMSPTLQVKLLRVLQEGTLLPVGGTQVKKVDVRVIAATHKDLTEMVAQGLFREDLFYRINVINILVPPLRERRDDIPVLIEHFMKKHHRVGQRPHRLSPETIALLNSYPWPGNIRELENEIERLLVLGSDLDLIPADLVSSRIQDSVTPAIAALISTASASGGLNEAVELLEREMIQQGLLRTEYNKSRLARELGISRSNLLLKIAKYGLDRGQEFVDAEEVSA